MAIREKVATEVQWEAMPNHVIPFPRPPVDPQVDTPRLIVCQIGSERFAIEWTIRDLPPPSVLRSRQPSGRAKPSRKQTRLATDNRQKAKREERSPLPSDLS